MQMGGRGSTGAAPKLIAPPNATETSAVKDLRGNLSATIHADAKAAGRKWPHASPCCRRLEESADNSRDRSIPARHRIWNSSQRPITAAASGARHDSVSRRLGTLALFG